MKTTAMVAEALISLREQSGEEQRTLFWQLMERYRADLINQALAILGNQADAEDVAQDSLCRAYTELDTLKDPRKVGSWLRSINRCKALDRLRRRKANREERMSTGELNTLRPSDHPHRKTSAYFKPDIITEESPEAQILTIVDRMPTNYREVFVMHYWEKLTLAEIALRLDIPAGTVRSRFARADEWLLKRLDH